MIIRKGYIMIKYYLFDFDGTLVDSMPTWAGVHIHALEQAGIPVPEDFVETITPLGNYRASQHTISLGLDIPLETYLEQISQSLYREYTTRIQLKPHVADLLHQLKREGVCLNVLTASPHLYVDPCLQRLGIYDLFEKVWTIDDFSLTKAQTEIYHAAAQRLGADITQCTMVDDNLTAISTAAAAGMRTLAIFDASSASSREALQQKADRYIHGFDELLKEDL